MYICAQLLQSCLTPYDTIDCSFPGSSVDGDSPGKNTGVSCPTLLSGIFPTQGLNLRLLWLLHCRWILYHWDPGFFTTETLGEPLSLSLSLSLSLWVYNVSSIYKHFVYSFIHQLTLRLFLYLGCYKQHTVFHSGFTKLHTQTCYSVPCRVWS